MRNEMPSLTISFMWFHFRSCFDVRRTGFKVLQASGHSDIVEALLVVSPINLQMSFRKRRQRYFCSNDDVRFRMIKAGDQVRPIWLNAGCPKAIGSCFTQHLKHAGESCPKQSLNLFESLQWQARFFRLQFNCDVTLGGRYLDYHSLFDSVRLRRERILEEDPELILL